MWDSTNCPLHMSSHFPFVVRPADPGGVYPDPTSVIITWSGSDPRKTTWIRLWPLKSHPYFFLFIWKLILLINLYLQLFLTMAIKYWKKSSIITYQSILNLWYADRIRIFKIQIWLFPNKDPDLTQTLVSGSGSDPDTRIRIRNPDCGLNPVIFTEIHRCSPVGLPLLLEARSSINLFVLYLLTREAAKIFLVVGPLKERGG